ncbi:uncharacterized protein LOC122637563 [Vespula pensylvanica]|uniref:Uncharacterized protein n=1 Tax=Vespula pensylvanica TaxID=30213 RepID=A0A834UEV6_VESPE|nr:uncharacterized protein LOC122637563 [Vespula pensylvanica]KAF7434826.1 hypothetical protein H0235_003017 [Vespula pensylvanica]
MLPYKFYVSTTSRIFNDASKLPPYLYYIKFIGKRLVSKENSTSECNIKDQSKPHDTCKQNTEAPTQYPKKTLFHFCCPKPNALSESNIKTIASECNEACKRMKNQIESITKFVNVEKQTIIESLKKEISVDKTDVSQWVKSISYCLDRRLKKLMQLDPAFASETRIVILRFKDHARNTFIALYCDLMPSIRRIETTLEELQNETSRCIEKATALIPLCFYDNSSPISKKCFLKNIEEARKILEQTMKEAQMKLNEVKRLRKNILRCHKEAINEATNEHSSEMQAFSKYLDDCIAALKKIKRKQ